MPDPEHFLRIRIQPLLCRLKNYVSFASHTLLCYFVYLFFYTVYYFLSFLFLVRGGGERSAWPKHHHRPGLHWLWCCLEVRLVLLSPLAPYPLPPPLTYQLGRIQGGGGNGAIAPPPPHIPPPPLTVKSLFETTILWHMFLKINISQIFLSKVCDFIYLELEKLNLTPTPLIWILNLLALQPIPPPPFYKWISPGTVGGGWLAPPPPPESCIRPCLSKLQLDGFSCLGARNSSTWRVWALYRPTEKACPRTSLLSTTGLSATTRSCTTRRATCPSTARSSKTSLVRGFRLFFEYLKSPSAPVMMVILVLKSKGCHFEYCK